MSSAAPERLGASGSSTSTIFAPGSTTPWLLDSGRFPNVEAIVADEVDSFRRRYHELEVEPLVAALRRQAETIREQELERALRDLGDVDPATAERIEHLSRTLVKKLLHEPTVRLRERAGTGDADEVADAVRELFGLAAPREP